MLGEKCFRKRKSKGGMVSIGGCEVVEGEFFIIRVVGVGFIVDWNLVKVGMVVMVF